ncbi:MAG: hypothetical protein FJ029_12725, partial [Actinobacteria bacterium]|nr:hypothetical protein [Actinomycetota bacterium]
MAALRRNRVKHKLQDGKLAAAVMGPMSANLADFIGPLGFDGIWFEAEHGEVDYGDIPNL